MKYILNTKKIKELLLDFYLSTGIAVAFYDSSMNEVVNSPVFSEWCNKIRCIPELKQNCFFSNIKYMKEAEREKKPVCYTCHSGLMEAIIPVLYEETIIGYMQIGQFRDQKEKYSSIKVAEERLSKYHLNPKEFLPLYQSLSVLTEDKFESVIKIVTILIKSFWEDGLIKHNRSMLSVKIERFIDEHILDDISIKLLCETFFLSKNALYSLFLREFNSSVGKYILVKRIQLAIDKLKNTELSITAVAGECGFNDYNYFIRAFKKQTGVTPLQFRKNK